MCEEDEGGDFDGLQDDPRFMVLAREAEMYQEGGFNLTADPQKAGKHGCILDSRIIVNGWMDGWMDGWLDRCNAIIIIVNGAVIRFRAILHPTTITE